jgi:hypothetical protein
MFLILFHKELAFKNIKIFSKRRTQFNTVQEITQNQFITCLQSPTMNFFMFRIIFTLKKHKSENPSFLGFLKILGFKMPGLTTQTFKITTYKIRAPQSLIKFPLVSALTNEIVGCSACEVGPTLGLTSWLFTQ